MVELVDMQDFRNVTPVRVLDMDNDLMRLTESDSLEHYEGTADYILYTTESGIFPFVKYEHHLAQINDYCVFLLRTLKAKVQEAEAESQKEYPENMEYFQEFRDYRRGVYLSWDFLYRDINKCTMLLLLLAFLESTLNEIANWFSEMTGIESEWKKVRNPKVSDSLHYIGLCCKTDLCQMLAKKLDYYDMVRKIRNRFVHNEWEQCTDRYEQFALADVIDMISVILITIERTAVSSGLLEDT